MRGQYRSPTVTDEWAVVEREESVFPRYAQGVASAPKAPAPLPVTAVPANGDIFAPGEPVTAIPAERPGWAGWDYGVAAPKPPEWSPTNTWGARNSTWGPGSGEWPQRGSEWGQREWDPPAQPARRKFRLFRKIIMWTMMVSLAPLLGVATLVAVYTSGGSPASKPNNGQQAGVAPNKSGEALAGPTNTDQSPATLETAAIVNKVRPSVVNVNSTLGLRNARAAGTGVILNSTGLVVTNNHVVQGATSVSVEIPSIGRNFNATVVGYDRKRDIAVLQLSNATGLTKITIANSNTVKVGDGVVALGNAGGEGGAPKTVTGEVTALNQSITATDPDGNGANRLTGLIQVAADIQSGDSGGPLVDRAGRLIGINTAASVDPQTNQPGGAGFAVPSNTAIAIAQQIQAGDETGTVHVGPTALLGVTTRDATGQVSGAAVIGVLQGGRAQRAGVQAGDIIRSVDGRAVNSADDLTTILDEHHPDEEIRLGWIDRNGNNRTATVRLATGPAG
jgi:S1-C subfamily serine protease